MLALAPVPGVPEIQIFQAPVDAALIDGDYRSDRPPPFWAFAWPGGVALARHVLDHPETVRGPVEARRPAQPPRVAAPRAALPRPGLDLLSFPNRTVSRCLPIIIMPGILHPFPHITQHVV